MENKHHHSRRWKIIEMELSGGIRPISVGPGYGGARALVRRCGRPIGWLSLPCPAETEIAVAQVREALAQQVGRQLLPVLLEGGPAAEGHAGSPAPISVVVCTRDAAPALAPCLQALQALDYPEYEIIVVDHGPPNDETARLVSRLPVRYVREDRPGLARARNRGIAAAQYGLTAFIDGAARPDRGWLRAIAAAFADPEVMAVTGMVAPAELETEAQFLFELGCGGMGHGFQRRSIRRQALGERDLLGAGGFGSGANMAFRREVFATLGLFDVSLDAVTCSGAGGDVEIFHRLVAGGGTLLYEPAALVWHTHPRDRGALRRHLRDCGRGFGAYLLTCARRRSVSRCTLLSYAVRTWMGGWKGQRLARPGRCARRLVTAELAGALHSPWAYAAAQVRARRAAGVFREEAAEHARA